MPMFDDSSCIRRHIEEGKALHDSSLGQREEAFRRQGTNDLAAAEEETPRVRRLDGHGQPAQCDGSRALRRRSRRPTILFHWNQFAPYQIDRLEALYESGVTDLEIVGVAVASRSFTYPWQPLSSDRVKIHDLYDDRKFEETTALRRLVRRLADLRHYKVKYAFLCNYDQPDTLVTACVLRAMGVKVFCMMDSKFDDKSRKLWREWLKSFYFLPYRGALVAGRRHREYLEFLGLAPDRVFEGYDTVSVARLRGVGGAVVAPEGVPFRARHFTIVARLIEKKNLFMAIDAYDRYRKLAGPNARGIHLCGVGELEDALKADVARRGLSGVEFRGFLEPDAVAKELAMALALILPSTEEQWGLVVNEALAMGVPVLCSDNVGARDSLVRTAVNGYVFEADNAEGLAQLMHHLEDEEEWRRLAKSAAEFAYNGDTRHFVSGVAHALSC
jgi:L-malate glycosyltransferase